MLDLERRFDLGDFDQPFSGQKTAQKVVAQGKAVGGDEAPDGPFCRDDDPRRQVAAESPGSISNQGDDGYRGPLSIMNTLYGDR